VQTVYAKVVLPKRHAEQITTQMETQTQMRDHSLNATVAGKTQQAQKRANQLN
jgi:hypothetical protein